jgi:GNAT superfamily N-acetyltransferase
MPDWPTSERARFRRAERIDVDDLLALVREYYEFDHIRFDEGMVRRGLTHLLSEPSLGEGWLITVDSELVGYFVLTYGFDVEFGGRQAFVTDLYLRPSVRRCGIGTAALGFIEEHLRRLGMSAYELQVERTNTPARAFYERSGFEAHDRIPLSKWIDRA